METTVRQLVAARSSLSKIGQKELPIKLSFKVTTILKKIQQELEAFDEERQKLAQKFNLNQNPNEPKDPNSLTEEEQKQEQEKLQQFQLEINQVLDEKANVMIDSIKISEFGDDFKISPEDLFLLGDVVSE